MQLCLVDHTPSIPFTPGLFLHPSCCNIATAPAVTYDVRRWIPAASGGRAQSGERGTDIRSPTHTFSTRANRRIHQLIVCLYSMLSSALRAQSQPRMFRSVDQDALCSHLFDLRGMSHWEYKYNVINMRQQSHSGCRS